MRKWKESEKCLQDWIEKGRKGQNKFETTITFPVVKSREQFLHKLQDQAINNDQPIENVQFSIIKYWISTKKRYSVQSTMIEWHILDSYDVQLFLINTFLPKEKYILVKDFIDRGASRGNMIMVEGSRNTPGCVQPFSYTVV
ncbi:hypothetical protein CHS0354_027248 [Potamilus streckersoni]|uniref:Uncharacterized protein n=1 Tax=Potamilus streckersoni TaxID=2493646 RepID=A0AAE0RXY9_9BIVA|nr:hypothetical protein CHS0354_027248 [Potamilus streckersoni]